MRKLLACLLLLALPAESQQAQRWYAVELIVFAQPGGSGAEQWEAEPTLAYPGAARFLLQPDRLAAALAEAAAAADASRTRLEPNEPFIHDVTAAGGLFSDPGIALASEGWNPDADLNAVEAGGWNFVSALEYYPPSRPP